MKVEIDEEVLLEIATNGKLGSGELGDYARRWARKTCTANGLDKKLSNLQDKKLRELRANITNVIGKESMDKIDQLVIKSTEAMKIVMKDKTEIIIN